MAGRPTRGAEVRLKLVFLKYELVVNLLNVGEVEVWLGYEERRLRCVNLPCR